MAPRELRWRRQEPAGAADQDGSLRFLSDGWDQRSQLAVAEMLVAAVMREQAAERARNAALAEALVRSLQVELTRLSTAVDHVFIGLMSEMLKAAAAGPVPADPAVAEGLGILEQVARTGDPAPALASDIDWVMFNAVLALVLVVAAALADAGSRDEAAKLLGYLSGISGALAGVIAARNAAGRDGG